MRLRTNLRGGHKAKPFPRYIKGRLPCRDTGVPITTIRLSSSVITAKKDGKMATNMTLSGDVNLMNVPDPAVPFSLVRDEFHAADIVFSNLECCLYQPSAGHAVEHEGFFADPDVAGEALRTVGIQAV